MGLDFIRKAAPTFVKAWSGSAEALAHPSLFTRTPECATRTVVCQLEAPYVASEHKEVVVMLEDRHVAIVQGISKIGQVQNPPTDLLDALSAAGGCGLGRIARLNSISETIDVEIE